MQRQLYLNNQMSKKLNKETKIMQNNLKQIKVQLEEKYLY